MDSKNKDKKDSAREITYQVGWKKGRISPNKSKHEQSPDVERMPMHSPVFKYARMFIWRPVPFIPAKTALFLMGLFPLISLAAMAWLVLKLR